ncbi:MAG: hypothetical protein DRJ66_00860 [Thermoprotei archaeon]|nr:MAG: hypothetical protein DRJ66_00860 [Thermoprotei archaeon]RLF20956.1 MAG: hypothetical protein DRZ82_00745 [Thermoprotei archaeon]
MWIIERLVFRYEGEILKRGNIRRIVEIGGSLYIALPKSWTKTYNVKKGDLLYVTLDSSGNLIISRMPSTTMNKVTIYADGLIKERLIAAYLKGYDVMEVRFKGMADEERGLIEEASRFLVGLEIVGEERDRVILQCLGTDNIDVHCLMKRMIHLTRSMINDALSAICDGNIDLSNLVIQRDDKVDRLYFLVVRHVRRLVYNHEKLSSYNLTPLDLMDFRLFAKIVEEIADYCEKLSQDYIMLRKKGRGVPDELVEYIRDSKDDMVRYFDDAVKSFFNKNLELALSTRIGLDKLRKDLSKLYDTEDVIRVLLLAKVDSMIGLIEDITDLSA